MSRTITARPLTREAFAEFGDVIDTDWANHYPINGGMTERYHDLAGIEAIGRNARVLISIFRGKPYAFPLELKLVERHPLGSQAFMPLGGRPYLVVVCHGMPDGAGEPHAFVDRGGDGVNLEEHHFAEPLTIHLPEGLT